MRPSAPAGVHRRGCSFSTPAVPTLADFRARLAAAQANARRLRAEAFVRYQPEVAGHVLAPVTLDTYNLLVGWENPFVVGGECDEVALHQFIWCHSPDFGQFAHAARRRSLRRMLVALHPRHPFRGGLARFAAPFGAARGLTGWFARRLRPWCEPTAEELAAAAIAECQRLVAEAIGEFPTSRPGPEAAPVEALPFALQAQILNLLRRELGLPFAETRALPLKELAQHLRELTWTASGGKAALLTPAEASVWAEYQEWREAQAATVNLTPGP